MLSTKTYRDKREGFADKLNYAAVIDEGVISTKDGAYMAGWFYRGADNHSATDAERNYQAIQINRTLKELGSGWMIHCDVIREPARRYDLHKRSAFDDPVTAGIERERAAFFNAQGSSYESLYALVVSYQPPYKLQGKVVDLMYSDYAGDKKKKKRKVSSEEYGASTLEYFSKKVAELESNLRQVLDMERMHGVPYLDADGETHINEQILSYVNRCITGDRHPINLPPIPMYLDAILGSVNMWGGLSPMIGDKYVVPVAISGFPHESYPSILQTLDMINTEYRWSTRFIFMDEQEAVSEITKYKKKWKQKVRGIVDQVFKTSKGTVNTDAKTMVQQAEAAINDVNSGEVAYGYYTSVIIFQSSDLQQAEEDARLAVTRLKSLGFNARVETANAIEAYFGSLPGDGRHNIRRPMLHTFNLAHLLPTSSIWAGEENAPCPYYPEGSPALLQCATHGSTPFRFNLHVGDLGHTIMLGPTGAGKSTHLGLIAAQFLRYPNANVFCFDKGRSMYALTKAAKGRFFDIAGEGSELAFAPLTAIENKTDQAWVEMWLETILKLQGVQPSPEQRQLVSEAVSSCVAKNSRTFTDLIISVQDSTLKSALSPYGLDGSLGHLLDADEDGLSLTRFTTFEIEELMNLDDKYRLPVLLYLFWRIERSLQGQPSLLILDEAWLMLGHDVFRSKIVEWLKVFRKSNCIVLMATQSISDAEKSGILDILTESTASKIFLPNPEARSEASERFYRMLGLNDKEIGIISSAKKKRQYYYKSEKGRRLYELALGPVALSFVGVSDKESFKHIDELERLHGDNWPQRWLTERGVKFDLGIEG